MRKAGVELLPKSLPSGSGLLEQGPGPEDRLRETCNGRPVWAHGYLPCWGNFRVEAEMRGNLVKASCKVGAGCGRGLPDARCNFGCRRHASSRWPTAECCYSVA